MCKPVLPVVQDALAHFFWKAEHIATVHHHHGHHHAAEEMATSTQEQESNKSPVTSKTSEPVSIHIIEESAFPVLQLLMEKHKYGIRIINFSSFSLLKHYPPPKSC